MHAQKQSGAAPPDAPFSGAGAIPPPLGIYVHFPWCLKKCPYCDFLSFARSPSDISHGAYADAVLEELEARAEALGPRSLKSIFVGGGTPSLWKTSELCRVLEAIRGAFPEDRSSTSEVECTVECNPSSFNEQKSQELARAGVNRVSLGVQSLDNSRLQFLGRWHDAEAALHAVRTAVKSAIPRVNADLIFGVAGQSAEDAVREARALARLGITHLSAYALTVEAGTRFGAEAAKGRLPLLGEDQVADSFTRVSQVLREDGFAHYEVSNFAKDGHFAQHNLGYWRGEDYLGLGTGAWGTVNTHAGRIRYRNTPDPDRYLSSRGQWGTADLQSESSRGLVRDVEPISGDTALRERLMLGLRLEEGVDVDQAARELDAEPWPKGRRAEAERLVSRGRLQRSAGRLRIPRDSWLFADDTIARLL